MKPAAVLTSSQFVAWMSRIHQRGFYSGGWPCWNWRLGGVLVTLWEATGLVMIYHDEGRHTECHPAETERCREAVWAIAAR